MYGLENTTQVSSTNAGANGSHVGAGDLTLLGQGDPDYGFSVQGNWAGVVGLSLRTSLYFLVGVGCLTLFFLTLDFPLIYAKFTKSAIGEWRKGWYLTSKPGVGAPIRRRAEAAGLVGLWEIEGKKNGAAKLLQIQSGGGLKRSKTASKFEAKDGSGEGVTWDILEDGEKAEEMLDEMEVIKLDSNPRAYKEKTFSQRMSITLSQIFPHKDMDAGYDLAPKGSGSSAPPLPIKSSKKSSPLAREIVVNSAEAETPARRKLSRQESWVSLTGSVNGMDQIRSSSRHQHTPRVKGHQRGGAPPMERTDSRDSATSFSSEAESSRSSSFEATRDDDDGESRDQVNDLKSVPRTMQERLASRGEHARKNSWASMSGSISAEPEPEVDEKGSRTKVSVAPAAASISEGERAGSTHATNLTSYLPYANRILLYTPLPRINAFTVSHLIILGLYALLVLASTFYKTRLSFDTVTNPSGPDYYRSANMAMAQLPVVLMTGPRNTLVKWLFANGRDIILVKLHKLAGRLLFLGAALHTFLYVHQWVLAGNFFIDSSYPNVIAGYISLGGLSFIVLSSLPYVRKNYHRAFKFCHWIGIFVFMLALLLHLNRTRFPYIITSCLILGVDWTMKLIKTKVTTAEMKAVNAAETTIVTFPYIRGGYRAGQYVVVRIPAVNQMGGYQGWEAHPFSVASAPGREGGLVLMIKSGGNWTKNLFELTKKNEKFDPELGVSMFSTKAIVEGPYGGQGNESLTSFSSVILVGGGSGITAPLSLCQDLLDRAERGEPVRARVIDFIWIVRTQEMARPFMRTMMALVQKAKSLEGSSFNAVRIHIYVTRVPDSSPVDLIPPHSNLEVTNSTARFSGMKVYTKRPDMSEIVNDAVDSIIRAKYKIKGDTGKEAVTHGCGVVVCGPGPVVTMVREAVRTVAEGKRNQIGGIDLMEEGFMY